MTVPGPQVTPSGRWVDLAQRVGSALVILVLGAGLLLAPSLPSTLGLAALFGAMLWELTRLVGPTAIAAGQQAPAPRPGPAVARAAVSVAVMGGGVMAAVLLVGPRAAVLFVLPLALGLRTAAVDLRGQFLAQFALMALAGFTINTLTLLALVLAIGLVVDDAIVVLENIYRHIEEGKTPFQAAIVGAASVAAASPRACRAWRAAMRSSLWARRVRLAHRSSTPWRARQTIAAARTRTSRWRR